MDNVFSFIKKNLAIETVIQEYVSLKKAGLYLRGKCPFHDEKNDSFTVSPDKGIFYCFGCHKGGDVISFIEAIENCEPIEAVEHLKERYNISLPNELLKKKHVPKSGLKIAGYTDVCRGFANFCHQELLKNSRVKKYLLDRNVSEKSINNFLLGYFPEKGLSALLEYMKKEGFLTKDLIEAHLIKKNEFGLYSAFVERIIFPIQDHLGRICGFGGRVFNKDDVRAKYYNSQDHDYFTKGKILYGLNFAKRAIKDQGTAFLTEGYLDCIAMVQAGYENSLATLGTACTKDHLITLSRYAQKLYVVYDGDNAGRKAIIKLAQLSWASNVDLYVVPLPKDEDPASYLEKNKDLEKPIENVLDIFTFFMKTFGDDYGAKSMQEKLDLLKDFSAVLFNVKDPMKRNFILQQASIKFDIPFKVLSEHVRKSKSVLFDQVGEVGRERSLAFSALDKGFFVSLINDPRDLSREELILVRKYLYPEVALLVDKVLLHNKNAEKGEFENVVAVKEFEFVEFLDGLSSHEKELAVRLVSEGELVEKVCLDDLIFNLWKREWKVTLVNFRIKIKKAEEEKDFKAVERIFTEFNKFKNSMREKGII